jgi:hypothetical protein
LTISTRHEKTTEVNRSCALPEERKIRKGRCSNQRRNSSPWLHQKYGDKYHGLVVTVAQATRNPQLIQAAHSPWVHRRMQVMPATGGTGVGDITETEPNIHAGSNTCGG